MSRRGLLLGLLVGGLATVLWYVVVLAPAGRDLDDAQGRVDSARRQAVLLEAAQPVVDPEADPAQVEADLTADLERLSAAVPDDPELADLVRTVSAAAQASGMELVALVPTAPAAGGATGPVPLPLEIQLRGDQAGLVSFLGALRAGPRIVVVQGLTVSPLDPTVPDSPLDVVIQAQAFVVGVTADDAADAGGDADPVGADATAPGSPDTTVSVDAAAAVGGVDEGVVGGP